MKLKDYIQGNRKGKNANTLEREALNDPFLQDALDGFDAVDGEHLSAIENLEKQIEKNISDKKKGGNIFWHRWQAVGIAATVALLLGIGSLIILNRPVFVEQVSEIVLLEESAVSEPVDTNINKQESEIAQNKEDVKGIVQEQVPPPPPPILQEIMIMEDALEIVDSDVADYRHATDLQNEENEITIEAFSDIADLSRAVQEIKVDEVSSPQLREQILSGKVAGVQVENSGKDASIRLRGSSSLSENNRPLIVVDGVPGGDLSKINTDEIVSVEVLKDASASAIYGSRGANGVVLVTTNRKDLAQNKESKKETKTKAESKKISGVVLDEQGEPLIGAVVTVKGTTNGVVTDYDGKYELTIPDFDKNKIVANYIGYESEEVSASNSDVIRMKESAIALSEVAVVGYGAQRRSDLTGAISSVSSSDMKDYTEYSFGKEEFLKYFKRKRKKNICVENMAEKPSLEASFYIDQDGKAVNIEIKSSDCDELTSEFFRLLEKSPKWTKTNRSEQVKIRIE